MYWDTITFQGNLFEDLDMVGASVYEGSNIDMSYNVFKDVDKATVFYIRHNGTFIGNRFIDATTDTQDYAPIDVQAKRGNLTNLTIANNVIRWTTNPTNRAHGIVVASEDDDSYILRNVSITGNVIDGGGFANCYNGIYLHGNSNARNVKEATITGNSAFGLSGAGCSLTYVQQATAGNNYFEADIYGLHLASSQDCVAIGNRLIGTTIGLREGSTADYNTLMGNNCRDSGTAYELTGSHDIFDGRVVTPEPLDLSGAAKTYYLLHPESAMFLAQAHIVYVEAASADAGVTLKIGKETDDDYYYTGASNWDFGWRVDASK